MSAGAAAWHCGKGEGTRWVLRRRLLPCGRLASGHPQRFLSEKRQTGVRAGRFSSPRRCLAGFPQVEEAWGELRPGEHCFVRWGRGTHPGRL